MTRLEGLRVGEALVGEGNEVVQVELILGPRGSAAETAFCSCLTNQKEGFTSLLVALAPNLPVKPHTVLFNKVAMKGGRQAAQMVGPAQRGVAAAVVDCLAEGLIDPAQADELYLCVGLFVHWLAEDDDKIRDHSRSATREAIARALEGRPTVAELLARRDET